MAGPFTRTEPDTDAPPHTTGAVVIEPMRIGRFVVLERIGSGGMGVVYAAYDPDLDRRVALKTLRPDRWGASDARTRDRALAEARAMAKVSHPNVVPVYEVGHLDDGIYVAMELIDGITVRQWMETPRAWRETLAAFVEIARGLAAVHAAGLVHRDMKPDNLMIRRDGRAQLLDFGIARALDELGAHDGRVDGLEQSLTAEHSKLVGTPAYMSPEQFERRAADARSDQWSLCVTLYEALYDRRPFDSRNLVELAEQVATNQPSVPPRDRAVPARLQATITRGLAKSPSQRWPSVVALADAWARMLAPSATLRRVALGTAMVGVLGLGLLVREPPASCDDATEAIDAEWNDPRSAGLDAAFQAAAPSWGGDAWSRTAAEIDSYAQRWSELQREVCEDNRMRGAGSSRMIALREDCLARSLGGFQVLLDELGHVDRDGVEHSLDALTRLRDVDACGDLDGLQQAPEAPDDAQREAVGDVRRMLAAVEIQTQLGEFEDAEQALVRAEHEAAATGYLPVIAEQALIVATVRHNRGDDVVAVSHHALIAALRAGDRRMAATAAVLHAGGLVDRRAPSDEVNRSLDLALVQVGDDASPRLQAEIESVRGAAWNNAGNYEDALAAFDRQAALGESATTPGAERKEHAATAAHNRSVVLSALGRHEEAIAAALEALGRNVALYGVEHPFIAGPLNNLAAVYGKIGDYHMAVALLGRAVVQRERAMGPEHRSLAAPLINLASNLESIAPKRAKSVCARANRILELAYGPRDPRLVNCLNLLGLILTDEGDIPGARATLERLVDLVEGLPEPDPGRLLAVLNSLARLEVQAGESARAEPLYRRALQVADENGMSSGSDIGFVWQGLARVLEDTGRFEESLQTFTRALDHLGAPDSPPEARAAVRFGIARMLVQLRRDPQRAEQLLLKARGDYLMAQPPRTDKVEEIDVLRARRGKRSW